MESNGNNFFDFQLRNWNTIELKFKRLLLKISASECFCFAKLEHVELNSCASLYYMNIISDFDLI